MFAAIGNILSIISAIKGLADMVYKFAQAVTSWYVSQTNKETMKEIADAAAASSLVETDEDAANASVLWSKALSRPRISK